MAGAGQAAAPGQCLTGRQGRQARWPVSQCAHVSAGGWGGGTRAAPAVCVRAVEGGRGGSFPITAQAPVTGLRERRLTYTPRPAVLWLCRAPLASPGRATLQGSRCRLPAQHGRQLGVPGPQGLGEAPAGWGLGASLLTEGPVTPRGPGLQGGVSAAGSPSPQPPTRTHRTYRVPASQPLLSRWVRTRSLSFLPRPGPGTCVPRLQPPRTSFGWQEREAPCGGPGPDPPGAPRIRCRGESPLGLCTCWPRSPCARGRGTHFPPWLTVPPGTRQPPPPTAAGAGVGHHSWPQLASTSQQAFAWKLFLPSPKQKKAACQNLQIQTCAYQAFPLAAPRRGPHTRGWSPERLNAHGDPRHQAGHQRPSEPLLLQGHGAGHGPGGHPAGWGSGSRISARVPRHGLRRGSGLVVRVAEPGPRPRGSSTPQPPDPSLSNTLTLLWVWGWGGGQTDTARTAARPHGMKEQGLAAAPPGARGPSRSALEPQNGSRRLPKNEAVF